MLFGINLSISRVARSGPPPGPPDPTFSAGGFSVGQAYALSVQNGGTGFHEFLSPTNAPQSFSSHLDSLALAGLFS